MLIHTLRRIRRAPLPSLAVLLFAAVLCTTLCGLEAANEKELANYKDIYRTTPVTLTVTDLTGTQTDGLNAPAWVANVFRGDTLMPHSLKEYVKDLKIRTSYSVDSVQIRGELIETEQMQIIGVTSQELIGTQSALPGSTKVSWCEGFDSSILLTGQRICLLPEAMTGDEELPESIHMDFSYEKWIDANTSVILYYDLELTVAGTHSTDDRSIYCPYHVVAGIYNGLEQRTELDCVSAVLIDNSLQEEAVQHARYWFPEPDLSGEKIPWNYSSYAYYPYALRVDDSLLRAAEETLHNSLTINRICTVIIYILYGGAGFLVGFLMIRSRKREIILMRTLGTRNNAICLSFLLAQMFSAAAGAALGGAYFLWHPVKRIGIFLGVYFMGLLIALVLFLCTNLISVSKEEE